MAQRELLYRIVEELREETPEDEGITLSSIQEELQSRIEDAGYQEEAYTTKWIRGLLEQHINGVMVIKNFVIFQETTEELLSSHIKDMKSKKTVASKAKAAVINVARILRSTIHVAGHEKNPKEYFDIEEISTEAQYEYVPDLLRVFLEELYSPQATKSKNTIAALGQALMKLVIHRKGPMPLLMALTALSHKLTGSKSLCDTYAQFGLGESYKELLRFNRNVAVMKGDDPNENRSRQSSGSSDILAADNADVNIETPSGGGSIHITGRIKATLDSISFSQTVPRKVVLNDDILSTVGVEIHHFFKNEINVADTFSGWIEPTYPVSSVQIMDTLRVTHTIYEQKTPLFAGVMRLVLSGNPAPHEPHSVIPLPFIDLKSEDYSALCTTLMDCIAKGKEKGMTAIVYFDQPLWFKAMVIKKSLDLPVVVMLGDFHKVLSYLAAIGYIMRGSGLEVLLEKEFSATVVKDILNGKSYRRGIRAHNLAATALKLKLLRQVNLELIRIDMVKVQCRNLSLYSGIRC